MQEIGFLEPNNMRPDWDSYFMQIAQVVATRSTCIRRQVGALIVKDNNIKNEYYCFHVY